VESEKPAALTYNHNDWSISNVNWYTWPSGPTDAHHPFFLLYT